VESVVKKPVCYVLQEYLPTSKYEDEEVEELYGIIEDVLEEDGKDATSSSWGTGTVCLEINHTETLLCYMNSEGETRGQILTDFYERNGLRITNIGFKKPKRRLYTWKAPRD
jgi:hypothetical protein